MLRFLYSSSGVLMWHPRGEATCGTNWVRITPEQIEAETGVKIAPEQFFVIEPLRVLADAREPGEPVRNDRAGTTYAISVPGGTGFDFSALADNPEAADAIARDQQTAEVTLPHDGGPVEIAVDLSEPFARLTTDASLEGVEAMLRWSLAPPAQPIDTTLPADVADPASCSG